MKKYEMTDETKVVDGKELHRIKCVEAFGTVKQGKLGGWIESEWNLSQWGHAWVGDNAAVYGSAKVFGDAQVYGNAAVSGFAEIYNSATIFDNASISDNAKVFHRARIFGGAKIFGDANIYGRARVSGDAKVFGNVEMGGGADICGDAEVGCNDDYAVHRNTWSLTPRFFTYTKSNGMWKDGNFYGTGKKLIKEAYKDNKCSGTLYKMIVREQEAIDEAKKGATK